MAFKRLAIAMSVFGLLAAFAVSSFAQDAKAPKPRTLKVKLNYSGDGVVDEKHPILVFLWDIPDFATANRPPSRVLRGTAKNSVVTCEDLDFSPVYLIAIFDKTGNYDGGSAPPSGSVVAQYGGQTPAPIKIEPGETVSVDLPLSDEYKIP
jgi:hypothetical protein